MRDLFVQDPSFLFLNSGSLSKTPLSIQKRMQEYQFEMEKNPTAAIVTSYPKLWRSQQAVGHFFHANPKDLFLRPNITAAFNSFFMGYSLEKGCEILTTRYEYGATFKIAKTKALAVGASMREIQFLAGIDLSQLTKAEILSTIEKEIRSNTKMLLVSHVSTGQGVIFPLVELAVICEKHGIALVVDGAHAPGSVDVNFKNFGKVAFYGGNLHKWMMGPKGTAFGWISPKIRKKFSPAEAGWASFEPLEIYKNFADGDHFAGQMLLSGTCDYAPYFAPKDLVDFWEGHGVEKLRTSLYEKQNYIRKKMDENIPEWKMISPHEQSLRGPILSYRLPKVFAAMGVKFAYKAFEKYQLQIASPSILGETTLRLTPHVYTSTEEMDRAVEQLVKIKNDPSFS